MNDIATRVRSQVKQLKKSESLKKTQVQHQIKLRKKSDSKINFLTVFLGLLILLMSLLIAGMVARKTGVFTASVPTAETKQEILKEKVIVERETIVENPAYLTKAEAELRFGKIDGQFSELEKKYKTWSYRSWITAVVVNENAQLAHQLDRRYHPQYQPDYLKLDKKSVQKKRSGLN